MRRLLPLLAFFAVAFTGIAATAFVWVSSQRTERIIFASTTMEAANRIEARIRQHLLLIEATAALFEAKSNQISAEDFATYFRSLSIENRHPGIVGLGYAAFVSRTERPALARALDQPDGGLTIWPETGQGFAAPMILFQSAEPLPPALGYDAYSEGARRAAMEQAILERTPRATDPVQLVRDPEQAQPGFLIFAPVYAENFGIAPRGGEPQLPTGFVFGGFRIGALLRAALDAPPLLPVHLRVYDVNDTRRVLYEYGEDASDSFGSDYGATHIVSVAGQEWRLEFEPTDAFAPSSARNLTLVLGAASLLIAAVAAALLREQARAQRNAELFAQTTQQNLHQKELMLQEMKHRIKNAITRILAIARQTAAGAEDMDSFIETFSKRLQAMSNAQDMLTRSTWQRADLRELITQELTQVFGPGFDAGSVSGPPIELDEKTTQALGLTFHELATNALKYGGAVHDTPVIDVTWRIERREGGAQLVIDWQEHCGDTIEPPQKTGFGTRLIDANVRHDLQGSIEREYRPTGLRIRLSVPLPAPKPRGGAAVGSALRA